MSLAIDLILICIVLFCVWRGYKSGIIRGVCAIVALIVAIFGANLVATAYSGEFTGMISPFVSGVVDTVVMNILYPDSDESDTVTANTPSAILPSASQKEKLTTYDIAFAALRKIGLPEKPADKLSALVAGGNNESDSGGNGESGVSIAENVSDRLCAALAYVAVFGVCFILLSIIFAVVGNLVNLVFSIPGLEALDSVLGMVLGLARGLVIILVIAAIVRYIGLVAAETVKKTVVLEYLVNANLIANILGI